MTQTVKTDGAVSAADRGRVLGKAAVRSGELLGLSGARLAAAIGVSESSVSRLAHGTRTIEPGSKEAELAALVIRCFRSLDALVGGDDAQRRAWMATYNRALNGVPRELVASAHGLVTTVAYLDRMRAPL
jgi:transcriptional regulator with XRE-family HTH domain